MAAPTLKENWQSILRSLPPNWDSYKAKFITDAAIETVEGFSVVPCNDGGLQLECHQDGIDMEISISPLGELENINFGPSPKK